MLAKKVECTEKEFRDFLSKFLNVNIQGNDHKISKLDWFSNMHGYYVADGTKNFDKIQRQLSELTDNDLKKLDNADHRMKAIFTKADTQKVTFTRESLYLKGFSYG